MEKKLRSSDTLLKVGEGSEHEVVIKRADPLDLSRAQQLPDIRHVLSRYFTLLDDIPLKQVDRDRTARQVLSNEIWFDWIFLNLPPVEVKNIGLRLDKLVNFVKSLSKYPVKKRGPTDMKQLFQDLDNGWDVRSFHTV